MDDKKNVPRMRSNSHDDVNENATEIVPLLSDGPSSDYRLDQHTVCLSPTAFREQVGMVKMVL